MTIITHGLTGSLITAAPFRQSPTSVRVGLAIGGFALGIAADLLVWYYATPDNRWLWYEGFHQNAVWFLYYLPPYWIHVILDSLTHLPEGGWAWYAYVIEVLFWPLNIFGLWWVFRK